MGLSVNNQPALKRSLSVNDVKVNFIEHQQVLNKLITKYSKMPKELKAKPESYVPNIKDFKEIKFISDIKELYKVKKQLGKGLQSVVHEA